MSPIPSHKTLPLRKDLRGTTIGDRKVIGRAAPRLEAFPRTRYLVRCGCGKVSEVLAGMLCAERQQRCPTCAWAKVREARQAELLSKHLGEKRGLRTLIGVGHCPKRQAFLAETKCDCGWVSSCRLSAWLKGTLLCQACQTKERGRSKKRT